MKKLYDSAISTIETNKNRVSSGKLNCIPFKNLKRFSSIVPGIFKSNYICVTAATSIGKTQFTKNLFIFNPIEFIRANPNAGVDYNVVYFALEESEEEFTMSLISYLLYKEFGIALSYLDLMSYTSTKITNDIVDKIKSLQPIIDFYLQRIKIYDNTRNREKIEEIINQHYLEVKDIPEMFTSVVCDHISLFDVPQLSSLHKEISAWSSYATKVGNKLYKFNMVNVHQQSMYAEDVTHFQANKLEPSIANLADNKLIGRDYKQAFGIFSPFRFNIAKHNNYDIKSLRNNYRSFKILKNRFGRESVSIGCYFNGAVNYVNELPPSNDTVNLQKLYKNT